MRQFLAVYACGSFSMGFVLFGLLGAPWFLTIGCAVLAACGFLVAIELPGEPE